MQDASIRAAMKERAEENFEVERKAWEEEREKLLTHDGDAAPHEQQRATRAEHG